MAVFENLNAGCVVRIAVDKGNGKYETVWGRKKDYKTPTFKATIPADRNYYFKRKRRKIQEAPDVVNPGMEYAILEQAVSGVVAVRVEFNFALLPGFIRVIPSSNPLITLRFPSTIPSGSLRFD